ncbi:response regulator transcription factor [Fulvivirga sp. 29W222]|uniref:Response regulator transcription factor n=1 Tax=Fulvivirga marina TaxID=2494733 RepID=A0A937FW36_9BACT|nr:response regulator transcription factor [Fulvivirga marina]MBL6447054.1 response regulator transcription factor [Fulvivirga marina]
MIKIVIIDDHKLFRIAISSIIKQEEDMSLIAEYSDPDDALKNCETDNPDLYLIDISLGEKSGLQLVNSFRRKRKDIKLIMLSMHKEEFYLIKSIEYDVDGYIHKDVDPDDLVYGIRKVMKGNKHYSSEVSSILINNVFSKVNDFGSIPSLSNREKEIIKYISEGKSSKEIANNLALSKRTVETHRSRILNRFGIKNTAELVKIAIENKII